MARLHQILAKCLEDRIITDDDVITIRDYIHEDGTLDVDDVNFLVQLLTGAKSVCAGFDDLFFPVLKDVILRDGKIDQGETFHLLKMLYRNEPIRDCELSFLKQLRDEATEVPEEFDRLLVGALVDHGA